MTRTTGDTTDLAATAKLAPRGAPTKSKRTLRRTWVADTWDLAALLRSEPGDPNYPDDDPRAGWRIVGRGDADQGPTLTANSIRIKQGLMPPFRDTQGGMFEASVSTDPNAPERINEPGSHAPAELWARWLAPADAAAVRERKAARRRSGTKHIVHRAVEKSPLTDEQKAERAARRAERNQEAQVAREALRAKKDAEAPALQELAAAWDARKQVRPQFSDQPTVTGLP